MRGRSTISDDDDIAVLRRCPAELLDELPFDVAWAIPGTYYTLLREVTDHLEYDVVKRQGITNVLEKLSIAACSAFERRIASYYAAGQASCLTPPAPLLSFCLQCVCHSPPPCVTGNVSGARMTRLAPRPAWSCRNACVPLLCRRCGGDNVSSLSAMPNGQSSN